MRNRPATDQPAPGRFSRGWFLNALRSGVWVVVITVLIWVYADLQFTDERNVRVALRVHAGSAGNLVLLEPAEDVPVTLRVKGDRSSIDRFVTRLAETDGLLNYNAASDLPPGNHPERTAEVLARLAEVRDSGLRILSAVPRVLDIHLDELKRVKGVPVEFQDVGGEAVDPKLEPASVDLLVPVSELEKIDVAALVLKTAPFDLSGYDFGEEIRNAPVAVPAPAGIKGVRLVTSTVRVSCKVGWQAEKEFTVRVDVKTPSAWLTDGTLEKYDIKAKPPEPWTRPVRVLGNRIDLERLRQEDIRAYVELGEAGKTVESWAPAPVQVILPPGLKVRLAPEPIRPVDYRLEKRGAAPAPP